MGLMAKSENKTIAEHISEAENTPDNIFFSEIPKRCFYLYNPEKEEINKRIDFRCENMIMKKNMLNDILDY